MRRPGLLVPAALTCVLAWAGAPAPARAADGPAQLNGLPQAFTAAAPASFSVPTRRGGPPDPPCGKTWESPVDGNWNDGVKWDGNDQPPNQVRVCLPASATPYTVTVPNHQTNNLAGLTIGAGATLRLSGASASMNAINDIINRGRIELHDAGQLFGSVLTNEGIVEDGGTPNPTINNFSGGVDNFGTLRANQRLNVAAGNAAIVNRPGATISAVGASSVLGLALNAGSTTFDGTVTNAGVVNVHSFGTLTLGAVAHTGNPITMSSPSFQTLIPSGTGTATVRTSPTTDLGADIGANMTVRVTALAGSGANLRLTADRTNNGTLVLDGETNGSVQVNSEGAPRRLTNAKNLDVKPGTTGGDRHLRAHLTNTATGDIDIDAGVVLTVDPAGDGWSHTSAGSIDIAATGAMNVFGITTTTFTQTAGTITVNGSFAQIGGQHIHQGGTVGGRIILAPRGAAPAVVDPSGPGAATYEARNGASLGGDVHADATVIVRGSPAYETGFLTLNGDRTNKGTLRLEDDGSREAHLRSDIHNPGRTLTNEGTLDLLPGGHRELAVAIVNEGLAKIPNDTQTLLPSAATTSGFTNSGGTVEVSGGWRTWGGYVQTSGTTTLLDGAIHTPRNAGLVDIQGGRLRGRGQIGGGLRNAGEVAPGTPTQRFGRISQYDVTETQQSVFHNLAAYEQTADGVLSVDINGTTPATQHDQLDVDGPLTLAGTLDLENASGYTPNHAIPDRFRVIDAESRTGTFTDVTGPDAGNYDTEYVSPAAGQAHVELKAVEPPPPPVRMSVEPAETTEGDAGTKSLAFTVRLNQASASTVTADWVTVDDSAVATSDYVAVTNGTVSFDPGQTQRTINVTINGDTTPEAVESFLVRLRNPNGAARLGVARAAGTILSDDFAISSVRPGVAGNAGTATLTIRGGGFAPGSTVEITRAGSPARVGEVLDIAADRSRIVASFDLTGAALGDWDVVVTEPGAGGDSVTDDDALQVVEGSRGRFAVHVSAPAAQRFGFAGRAVVSIRNEGTNDTGIELIRMRGRDVRFSLVGDTDFHDAPIGISGDDLAEQLDGAPVIPPGETRRIVVRFMSTTQIAHAPLRIDADVYPTGYLDGQPEAPDEAATGEIRGRVLTESGEPVPGIPVSASRPRGAGGVAVSGPDGAFTMSALRDATYAVGVGEEPSVADEREQVVVGPANRSPSVDLVADVALLSGTVRSAGGARLGGAHVTLVRQGRILEQVRADGQGGYAFAVVADGTYDLIAVHESGRIARRSDVGVDAGSSQPGLTLTAGGRQVGVTVNAAGGGPIAGATVIAIPEDVPTASLTLRTNAQGEATFAGLPADGIDLEARAPGRAASRQDDPPGPDAAFTLQPGGRLAGTLTVAGSPAGRDGMVIARSRTSQRQYRDIVDGTGGYEIDRLDPGLHDVWFVASGGVPKLVEGVSATSGTTTTLDANLLTTGGTPAAFAVNSPDGGSVYGATFSVRHVATDLAIVAAQSADRGIAEVGPLPPGEYMVDVSVPGRAPASHPLTVGASRRGGSGSIFDEYQTSPWATIPRPADPNEPWRDPFTQLPAPELDPKHAAGWHLPPLTLDYPVPCPEPARLVMQITSATGPMTLAYGQWVDAWTFAGQQGSNDVGLYLSQAGEILAKAYGSVRVMASGSNMPVNGVGLAAFNALAGTFYQSLQKPFTDWSRSDYQDKTQEMLEMATDLMNSELAEGGFKAAAEGAMKLVGMLNIARDLYRFSDDVDKFPDDVKNRGQSYYEAGADYKDRVLAMNKLVRAFYAAVARCPDTDDDNEPPPGGSGGADIDNRISNDPNEISGPSGVGTEKWIPAEQDLGYQISFENLGPGSTIPPGQTPASAPAAIVTITHELDDDVDIGSVELGDIGWGDRLVQVPAGLQSFHTDVPQTDGDIVRVDGAVDTADRELTWTLTTIDPATGEVQVDADRGFLPPEDGSRRGIGFVSYGARTEDGLAHGTEVAAQASIVFDVNAPIATNEHVNTIDATRPVSSVTAAAQPDPTGPGCVESIALQWSGSDAGSGVQHYDVWVSQDGAGYVPWRTATTQTAGTFPAPAGSTFHFYSVARDRVGNDEAPPPAADRSVQVAVCDDTSPDAAAQVSGAAAQDGWRNGPVSVALTAFDNAGGTGIDQLLWSASGAKTGGASVNGDETTVQVAEEGVTELTYRGVDAAGNEAAARRLTVRIDTTGPTIAIAAPGDGARYTLGQSAVPAFTCADAGIGVASCTGGGIDTSSLGSRTFTVTGVDRFGHTTTATRSYTVVAPPSGGGEGQSPVVTPRPPVGPPSGGVRFGARPVVVTLGRMTSARSLRLTLRNAEPFALTGRALVTRRSGRRTVALGGRRTFSLRSRGRASLTITLNRAARRALRNGRTVRATLTLELRAGAARKTITQALTLRVRGRR